MQARLPKTPEESRLPTAIAGLALAACLLLGGSLGLLASPAAADSVRTVHFRGENLKVPASWPVYRLAAHPGLCVRLDRRAVYLGVPSVNQRCPAQVMGRRRAIVVDPSAAARRSDERAARRATPAAPSGRAQPFKGLGFDACTAPSSAAMSTWLRSSPYGAIGVYVGGENRGCSQANLTSGWVKRQTGAGWKLIPTYVGLQSPTSSCSSCATISPSRAASQGATAAAGAVADAHGVGIGPGSPIYFDMESYTRTSSATRATLTFLSAWTTKLHALGYTSGVYSSSASGIVDLVGAVNSRYELPDNIWFANWNGQHGATDPYISKSAWTNHQRIHQYRGGHDETYRGVRINIDNNFIDGATAPGEPPVSDDDPVGRFELAGSPRRGDVRVRGWAVDPNAPTAQLSITAYVGGRIGEPRARAYELGKIATDPRPDVGAKYLKAGPDHGFDEQFASISAGAQRICVYAGDIGPGSDRLLGCRTVGIQLPLGVSGLEGGGRLLRATLHCQRPTGMTCRGQVLFRAHPRVRVPHRRGRPGTRVIRLSLARRTFTLAGGRSHTFTLPLNRGARPLLRKRRLQAKFLVAMSGGRRVRSLAVGTTSGTGG